MNIKVSAVFEENGKIEPEYIYLYDGLTQKQMPHKLKVEAIKKVYNIHIYECSYARNGMKQKIKIKYHLRGNFWFSDMDGNQENSYAPKPAYPGIRGHR